MQLHAFAAGGGGFIRSHLARYLYRAGHFVRVVDLKFNGYSYSQAVFDEKLNLTSGNRRTVLSRLTVSTISIPSKGT